MHNGRKLNAVDQKIGKYGVYYEKYYFFKRTRPNEFRSMTARKDYILPQKTAKGHKEVMQDHTLLSLGGPQNSFKLIQFNKSFAFIQ